MPATGPEAAATDLQKSIFNAPPGSVPSKPVDTSSTENKAPEPGAPHGTKRPREEEEENDAGEAPMEEDDESDAPMEDSSDED